jgi:hypothetical protein
MQNYLVTAAVVATLVSPATVVAGEKTITVPVPKTITLVCSDDVEQGSVVLTNPPKFSCKDYENIQGVIGLGITIGPDSKALEISQAIKSAQKSPVFVEEHKVRPPQAFDFRKLQVSKEFDIDRRESNPKVQEQRRAMISANRADYWRAWDTSNGTYTNKFEGIKRNRSFFND